MIASVWMKSSDAMDHLPQLQPLVPIENRSANQRAEHGNTNSQQAADVMHSVPG
jgi:hypothetical protein